VFSKFFGDIENLAIFSPKNSKISCIYNAGITHYSNFSQIFHQIIIIIIIIIIICGEKKLVTWYTSNVFFSSFVILKIWIIISKKRSNTSVGFQIEQNLIPFPFPQLFWKK
jgi:hypothetical protein